MSSDKDFDGSECLCLIYIVKSYYQYFCVGKEEK